VRTYSPKPSELQTRLARCRRRRPRSRPPFERGRAACFAASTARSLPPTSTPVTTVIVINAAKIVMTADKSDRSFSYRHSGYPGGLRTVSYARELADKPEEVVRRAIKGMLPKGRARPQNAREAEGLRRSRPPARRPAAHSPRFARRPASFLAPKDPASWQSHSSSRPVAASAPSPACACAPEKVPSRSTSGRSRSTSPQRRTARSRPNRCASPVPSSATTLTATIDGGGIAGQAGALRLGIARGLIELEADLRGSLQEGGHAHARRAREGEQEVRL